MGGMTSFVHPDVIFRFLTFNASFQAAGIIETAQGYPSVKMFTERIRI